jgi:hypothetical protein
MVLRKADEYQVDETDPWKNDKLDRKKIADYLTPVIASVTQPFTISIHSPYGTGKTSFVKSWQADLRKQGYKTVYFNAWETDFSHDAFFAFMAAVQRGLTEQEPKKRKAETIAQRIAETTTKGAGFVGEKALPLILRGLAKKMAGDETVEGFLKLIGTSADDVGALVGTLAEEGLKSQAAAEKSRDEFRQSLKETVVSMFDEATPPEKRKIIIFIDDLDRCRPTYAVAVLEAIKHLFSVQGFFFVLSIDEGQVRQAVRTVYGGDWDASGYLRKFIDWRFQLPMPSRGRYVRLLADKFSLGKLKAFSSENNKYIEIINTISSGAECFQWSLRECNAFLAHINLVCRALPEDAVFLPRALALCAVLHNELPELVERACEIGSSDALIDRLRKVPGFKGNLGESDFPFPEEMELIFSKSAHDRIGSRVDSLERELSRGSGAHIDSISMNKRISLYNELEKYLKEKNIKTNTIFSLAGLALSQIKDAGQLSPGGFDI